MTDSDDFTPSDLALSLQQVTKIDSKELGRGAHGEVNYLDKISAIEQIQSKVCQLQLAPS